MYINSVSCSLEGAKEKIQEVLAICDKDIVSTNLTSLRYETISIQVSHEVDALYIHVYLLAGGVVSLVLSGSDYFYYSVHCFDGHLEITECACSCCYQD